MAIPIHEIMAESSAGMARERARKKDIEDRQSYGLGNLRARLNQNRRAGMNPNLGNTAGRRGWKSHPFLSRSMGRVTKVPFEDNRFSGIMKKFMDLYGNVKSGLGKITQPGYFGGLQAAEINPERVLESDWA